MAASNAPSPWLKVALGQPQFPAVVPAYYTNFRHPMSFFQRVVNTFKTYTPYLRFRHCTSDVQNALMKKYIDADIPSLEELQKDVVLTLTNSWHSLHGVQPLTPGVVEVGGLHVKENYAPLSKELKEWLEKSTSGVIYFTLGSMVNIETFPNQTMQALYTVFEKIAPVRVLMKVANAGALLPGLPENVMTASWMPQVAILAHANTKMFITHRGLMSTQEALTYGVPLIGIPLFGDQHSNIFNFVSLGMAIKLDFMNITEKSITWAVTEILNNPQYRLAAKKASTKFLDRPLTAMDTAIYWIEYAIRHGPGALRSPVVDLPWWQVDLLDVYAFLGICISVSIYVIMRIGSATFRVFVSRKVKSE